MSDARSLALPLLVLSLALAALPAAAQLSPPPGVLTLPKKHAGGSGTASAPVTPPKAAPVAPVQQVAPFSSPRLVPAPVKPYQTAADAPARPATTHKGRKPEPKKPTPVVQAPPHVHAQRPATPPPPQPAPDPKLAAPAQPPETKGTVTGLPLPRWASLRADEVNMRVGPGMRFPIEWQYRRRDLPVQILREVEVWRLVRDQDGVKGWVHQATLIGRRGFVVKVAEAVMHSSASETAAPVARLKEGVVGRIRGCAAGAAWCEVQVGDYRGWVLRDQIYGTDPGEAVGN